MKSDEMKTPPRQTPLLTQRVFLQSISSSSSDLKVGRRWIKCGVLELEISRGFGEKYKRTLEIISSYQFGYVKVGSFWIGYSPDWFWISLCWLRALRD
ncbi:hypothetical protein MRB53_034830 [Persea americana]|uniref:Uncharacterized protein n=1 Tax=Persea americana TaxID=3435 RepID=A0ACC2K2W6_PERAE|nr:hypothetical protein MRB53_034830 [Persea americana]